MFKSFDHKSWEGPWGSYTYDDNNFKLIKLVDDDFECWIKDIETLEIEIIKEYSDRNLDVGKNLALFIIYYSENLHNSIEDIIEWQENNLPSLVSDWVKLSEERDYWLKKFLTWS